MHKNRLSIGFIKIFIPNKKIKLNISFWSRQGYFCYFEIDLCENEHSINGEVLERPSIRKVICEPTFKESRFINMHFNPFPILY